MLINTVEIHTKVSLFITLCDLYRFFFVFLQQNLYDMCPILDLSVLNKPEARKKTPVEKLDEKFLDYLHLAENILKKEISDENRYDALCRLYEYIDCENGAYADDVDIGIANWDNGPIGIIERWKLLKQYNDDWQQGEVLKSFIATANKSINTGMNVTHFGGKTSIIWGWSWYDNGTYAAPTLIYALLDAIYCDLEYLRKQIKIIYGKEPPSLKTRKTKQEQQNMNKTEEYTSAKVPKWIQCPKMKVPPELLDSCLSEYLKRLCNVREQVAAEELSMRKPMTYWGYNDVLRQMLEENEGYLEYYEKISEVDYQLPKEAYNLKIIRCVDDLFWSDGAIRIDFRWRENPFVDNSALDKEHLWEVELFYVLWSILDREVRELYRDLSSLKKIDAEKDKPAVRKGKVGKTNTFHYSKTDDDSKVISIMEELKKLKWKNKKVYVIGLIDDSITNEEWLYAIKGEGNPIQRKLMWKAKFACRSFVEQYLDKDYDTAEKIFCLKDGKSIKNLKDSNLSKRQDICNEKTGEISKIIR